jgi:hypothetical protein
LFGFNNLRRSGTAIFGQPRAYSGTTVQQECTTPALTHSMKGKELVANQLHIAGRRANEEKIE